MSAILSLVGAAYPVDVPTQNVLWTIILMCIYSALYRENIIYSLVEHAMVGTVAAQVLVGDIQALWRTVFAPISAGGAGVYLIVVVIGGITYFTVFGGRRMATFYRTVISMRIGAMLGISIGAYLTSTIYGALTLSARITSDPFTIVAIVIGLLTLFYFTFSKFVDTKFRIAREAGRWVVFAYYAGFGATLFLTRADNFAGWVYRMSSWPAILIPIGAFAIIMVDNQLRKSRIVKEAIPTTKA